MANSSEPHLETARKALPPPLLKALQFVFSQRIQGCWLAGGTALAGFYAGHRRSDDLDFFTLSNERQKAAALAIKALSSLGGKVTVSSDSNQFFAADGELDGHFFKITVVLDSNLFQVGRAQPVAEEILVVDLDTIFKMKAATLVSRCSEKDLYDLIWLFKHFADRNFNELIRLGAEIDAGVDAEIMLASVGGASLRESACDFSLDPVKKPKQTFAEVSAFRDAIVAGLHCHLKNDKTTPRLGELVKRLR